MQRHSASPFSPITEPHCDLGCNAVSSSFESLPSRCLALYHLTPSFWRFFTSPLLPLAAWSNVDLRCALGAASPRSGRRITLAPFSFRRVLYGAALQCFFFLLVLSDTDPRPISRAELSHPPSLLARRTRSDVSLSPCCDTFSRS
eukprot:1257861-Rhodomonas_salina.1